MSEKVYDGYYKVFKQGKYEWISRNDYPHQNNVNCVVVIAMNEDGKFVVLRQFRPALNDWVWEFPAGKVDDGEFVIIAAARELKEETGLDATDLRKFGSPTFLSPGITDESTQVVLARTEGVPSDEEQGPDEQIEIHLMTKKELGEKIMSGEKMATYIPAFFLGLVLGEVAI